MKFKYVFDENLTVRDEELPNNVINARDLYYQNGLKTWCVPDQTLLSLAIKHEYIIITRDIKLVILANRQNADIVYARGKKGRRWYFVPKEARLTNMKKLLDFLNIEITKNEKDQVIVKDTSTIPFYAIKGSNKIDLREPKFFEGMKRDYDGTRF